MTYRVELRAAAARDLDAVPPDVFAALDVRIQALGEEPRPPGVRALEGYPGYYRIRWRDYRAVFKIDDRERTVRIVAVGHRRDIYRTMARREL